MIANTGPAVPTRDMKDSELPRAVVFMITTLARSTNAKLAKQDPRSRRHEIACSCACSLAARLCPDSGTNVIKSLVPWPVNTAFETCSKEWYQLINTSTGAASRLKVAGKARRCLSLYLSTGPAQPLWLFAGTTGVNRSSLVGKHKNWYGFWIENGWKGAPVLEFYFSTAAAPTPIAPSLRRHPLG